MAKHNHHHRNSREDAKITKALAYEISFGDISKVREILATEPNINDIRGYSDYPLFIAAAKTGKPELISLFLDYATAHPDKANVNILDDRGANAIIALSISPRNSERVAQIVQLLIDGSVDPTIITRDGYTALHAAVQRHNIPVARLLLENGANPNIILTQDLAEEMENIAPIHYAALERDLDMIELLITYGADINLKTKSIYKNKSITAKKIYVSDSSAEEFDQAVARGLATRAAMLSPKGITSSDGGTVSEDTTVGTKKHALEDNEQSNGDGEAQPKDAKHSHAT